MLLRQIHNPSSYTNLFYTYNETQNFNNIVENLCVSYTPIYAEDMEVTKVESTKPKVTQSYAPDIA